MARVWIWENSERVACGFLLLLRVTDHEAVLLLLDPKLFSSLVPRSVVLLKRSKACGRQAAGGSSRENLIG
jgi:hypothetical protein